MRCAKCDFENPGEAKFCGKCGEATQAAVPISTSGSLTGGGEAVSQGLKIGIIIGTIFVPLLGIVMGAIYMNDANLEKKKVGRLWLYVGIGMVLVTCICTIIYLMALSSMSNMNGFVN